MPYLPMEELRKFTKENRKNEKCAIPGRPMLMTPGTVAGPRKTLMSAIGIHWTPDVIAV